MDLGLHKKKGRITYRKSTKKTLNNLDHQIFLSLEQFADSARRRKDALDNMVARKKAEDLATSKNLRILKALKKMWLKWSKVNLTIKEVRIK